jgi:D-sedoheptulose 7-phosphate isomerase
MEKRIINQFNEHLDVVIRSIEPLTPLLESAGIQLVNTLLGENKILCCASASLSPLADLFSSYVMNRFLQDRPGFPVVNLNADTSLIHAMASDNHYNDIYAKQIIALGQPGDMLVLFSMDKSTAILQAIKAAHDRQMGVLAITGGNNGDVAALLEPNNIELLVPDFNPARVLETQVVLIHQLCHLLDMQIFGISEESTF